MELLWSSDIGLTSIEMLDILDDAGWNMLNIFQTINSLIDKDLIMVSDFEHYNTQYHIENTTVLLPLQDD